MTVRETITVDSTRRKIRRGIFRDFPTRYKDLSGNRFVVGFEVQEVLRNGEREPYRTERLSNGIRIGDADALIPKGRHVYRITYRTDRQLGFFDDFDELFWNVTGNGWDFPIERARATVHLPDGARVLNRTGYTGRAGERGRDFTYTAQNDETLSVETRRTLRPGEGLTIAVWWPRGFVQRPSNEQRLGYVLHDNVGVLAGVFGLAILFAYYLIAWAKVGRDPETGPIFPLYAPPNGVSPAGARYVTRMGFDDKTFTAAIVSMAVKGFLTVEKASKRAYTLELTGQSAGLSKGESAFARKLFSISRLKIELKQKNHKTLQAAKKALQQLLRTELKKIYFVRNTGYFAPGIGLTVLALIALVAAADQPFEAMFASVWLTIWTGVVNYLGRRAWLGWQAAIAGGGSITRVEAVFATLFFAAVFLAAR